jgi:hypothetical protein
MSPAPATSQPLRVIILGNDALLEGRPATSVQMAQACLRAGFDFVAPISWGEELLAERMVDAAASGAPATVACHCPIVARALEYTKLGATSRAILAAPPVATARYVRIAFGARPIHVTFVGRCPGGRSPDIDQWITPEAFWSGLGEAGIDPRSQPMYFDSLVPPDRRRFASVPGGVPYEPYLQTRAAAYVREVAMETLAVVASTASAELPLVLDPSAATGCFCSRHRREVEEFEPARARSSVVVVDLAPQVTAELEQIAEPPEPEPPIAPLVLGDERPVEVPVVAEADASEPETMVESVIHPEVGVGGERFHWARCEEEEALLLSQRDERANGNGTHANEVTAARVADERKRPHLEGTHEIRRT